LTKIAGSASGSGSRSISQRHRSADPDPDPDPHQNVMDPQHWLFSSYPYPITQVNPHLEPQNWWNQRHLYADIQFHFFHFGAVLWIRIRSYQELFCQVGSDLRLNIQ
jgi:hypothetical protein